MRNDPTVAKDARRSVVDQREHIPSVRKNPPKRWSVAWKRFADKADAEAWASKMRRMVGEFPSLARRYKVIEES